MRDLRQTARQADKDVNKGPQAMLDRLKKHFDGRVVIVTGHTGFKGSWLSLWLMELGARVIGISEAVPTSPSNFESLKLSGLLQDVRCDVRNYEALSEKILESQPDYVFHLAAQPIVVTSFQNPLLTVQTNVLGTSNLLMGLRQLDKKCACVLITSDKCYENQEWEFGYRENDRLGGSDPYSMSKACAEMVIKSFCDSYFSSSSNIRLGVARAGNVIGGGDWAPNRIVPDAMRSILDGCQLSIRNPDSTRPWQHVLEPLSGYLCLAISLIENTKLHGQAFNFGPTESGERSVATLLSAIKIRWPEMSWKVEQMHAGREAGLLKLNCDKAAYWLGWQPVYNFNTCLDHTVSWYQAYADDPSNYLYLRQIATSQIHDYCLKASELSLGWSE